MPFQPELYGVMNHVMLRGTLEARPLPEEPGRLYGVVTPGLGEQWYFDTGESWEELHFFPTTFAGAPATVESTGNPGMDTPYTVARGNHQHALGILTTRGDTLVRDANGVTRLPIGAANRFLQSNGADLVFANAPAGEKVESHIPLVAVVTEVQF